MAEIPWTKIIAFVLKLVADGLEQTAAISQAAAKFNVSTSDIKSRL